MLRSLGSKLLLSFLFVGLIGILLLVVLAIRTTASEFGNFQFARDRDEIITELAAYYETSGSWEGVEINNHLPSRPPAGAEFPRRGQPIFLALVDKQGVVILGGPGFRKGDMVSDDDLNRGQPIEVDKREVGQLILLRGSGPPDVAGQAFLEGVNRVLLLSALGASLVAVILGVFLTRALTRPIRELTEATRAVAAGDLDQEVPVRSKDELGQLATSFNQMNQELARARDLRRQMTADIAHELRTPLSVIIGHTEAVHDGVLPLTEETLDIIRDEVGRLERLVEDLRTLARSETGEIRLELELISPVALLERAAASHAIAARQVGISLEVGTNEALPDVFVDVDRMGQVLGNLLENAIRFTPSGGKVILAGSNNADEIRLTITDTGSGIDAEELDRIFQRFYRPDTSRERNGGGSGLGLAIAKSLVEAHGGRIWAESEPGLGTNIIIQLPAASQSN